MMLCLSLATILISIYIIAESIGAIAHMPGGLEHFCHKVKYVLAFSSSLVFIYYAATGGSGEVWLAFGSAGTIAFFIWPRTVWRFRQQFESSIRFERNDL